MSLRTWIRQNRAEIDRCIDVELRGGHTRRNDEERRLWVLNWEPLYLAARAAGVKV